MSLYDRIFKPRTYRLANGKEVEERFTRLPLILLILLVCTVVSVRVTGFSLQVLVSGGKRFFDILFAIFPPNTKYLRLVRLFPSLVRTLPTLVCALIATYIFGLGTMAGTCSIAVFTFAYVGKQLFELIETADMGSFEAMEALGATRTRAFLTAIFPQILPTYLSVSLFCLEGNVRYASILGYVGAGGLGLIMNEKIGWREYDSVGMILIVLFVTVVAIEGISHAIRKRLT